MDSGAGEPDLVLDAQAAGGRTARNGHCACDLGADAVHGTEDRGSCVRGVPCSAT